MRDFNITQRIVAAIDRSEDPHLAIDVLRQEVLDQGQDIQELARELRALKNAELERLTKTGAWFYVKAKLNDEAVDWSKWALRGSLAAIGTALLGGLLSLAWKGFRSG